jgi:hypothetical protein
MSITGSGHPRGSGDREPSVGPTTSSGVSSANRWSWLASTRVLQAEAFGKDFSVTDPDEFADSIVMNHTALVTELSEFMNEVGWKDWITPRGWVNREAAVGELVDAAHFLANLLVRLDVTDEEWEQRYQAKQEVNRNRQRVGYDGVSNKCLICRRAYDDTGVTCEPGVCNYTFL